MARPTIAIGATLGVPDPFDFIIGDPTRGQVHTFGTQYKVSTGFSTITPASYAVSVSRGRWSRLWDSVDAGTGNVYLYNQDREFDPAYLDGSYAGYITPGRAVRVQANGITIWTGYVDDWDLDYDVSGRSTATLSSVDALGVLGQMEFDAWTSSYTSANTKLSEVCDRTEVMWPAPLRVFDQGIEELQQDNVSHGSNVLNYTQLIARSDLGYLFASADGILTFRNRYVASGVAAAVSFTDDGATDTIPYRGIRATIGSELLFARTSVDREGGTAQSSTVTDLPAWRDLYGPTRSLTIAGLLLADDSQSSTLADYLLALYDTPRYRVSELDVDLLALSASEQNAVLALDVTSVVSVTFTPNKVGDPIVETLVVQGLRHDIAVDRHILTLSLIDPSDPYFRIGDAVYGLIGSEYVLGF